MKHQIAFLCPFFGTVDQMLHRLWLKSCKTNDDFDFIFITDDSNALKMPMPSNVKGVFMKWENCVARIMSKFDFAITLEEPYKLCDFRPAYGIVFSDLIREYDFWGHMDSSDTILGNLHNYITDDLMDIYDKIHSFGHLTLYRNTLDANKRFQISSSCGTTIQELFSRSEVMGFDEMNHPWSINTIYKENGFSLLERIPNLVADILPSKYSFQIVEDAGEKIPRIFEWDHGNLFDVTTRRGEIHKREIGYVHFQKRKMTSMVPIEDNHFYMIPNCFIPANQNLTCEMIEKWSKDKLYLDPFKRRVMRIIKYTKQPEVFARKLKEKLTWRN